jgi:hypothetical protein
LALKLFAGIGADELLSLTLGDASWWQENFDERNRAGNHGMDVVAARRWLMRECSHKGVYDVHRYGDPDMKTPFARASKDATPEAAAEQMAPLQLPAPHAELVRVRERLSKIRRQINRRRDDLAAERARLGRIRAVRGDAVEGAAAATDDEVFLAADAALGLDKELLAGEAKIASLQEELRQLGKVSERLHVIETRELSVHHAAMRQALAPAHKAAVARIRNAALELLAANRGEREIRAQVPELYIPSGVLNVGTEHSGRLGEWLMRQAQSGALD